MKIPLQLTAQRLQVLAASFLLLNSRPENTKHARAVRNILNLLAIKICKKQLEMAASANLFTAKKKATFKLEYFEAYYLEEFIGFIQDNADLFQLDTYTKNVLLSIRSHLNQTIV